MKKGKVGQMIFIGSIGTALIWGAVIIGCSLKLKGTGCYSEIQNILVAGTFTNLIIVWGLIVSLNPNKKDTSKDK